MVVAMRGRGERVRLSCFTVDPDETLYAFREACRVDQATGVR